MTKYEWTASDPKARIVPESDVIEQLQFECFPDETARDRSSTESRTSGVLEHLVKLGLPFSVREGGRFFDGYEVLNFLVWAHFHRDDHVWAETCVATMRKAMSIYADHGDRRFTVTSERKIATFGRPPGSPARLHFPVPTETAALRDLTIEWQAGPDVRIERAGDVLDVRASAPREGETLDVTVTIRARSGWQGEVVEPARVEAFREPDARDAIYLTLFEGPVKTTEPIRALALEIAGDAPTPWDAMKRFWDYYFSHLMHGNVRYHDLAGPDALSDLLRGGRSDCWFGSALLVAFCRARGIPARIACGYGIYESSMGYHFWVEALMQPYGWLPFHIDYAWALSLGNVEDRAWSEYFMGRVDPRITVERLPRAHMYFGPRLPRTFYLQQRLRGRTTEVIYRDLVDGSLAMTERFTGTIER